MWTGLTSSEVSILDFWMASQLFFAVLKYDRKTTKNQRKTFWFTFQR